MVVGRNCLAIKNLSRVFIFRKILPSSNIDKALLFQDPCTAKAPSEFPSLEEENLIENIVQNLAAWNLLFFQYQ